MRKAAFLTPLLVRVLTDELFILVGDLGIYSEILGREHWTRRGKPIDFASVPRWPGAYLLTGGKAKWESVTHDEMCDQARNERERLVADRVFVELMGVSAEFQLEESWETEQIRELHAKDPENQRLDDVRINPDGSVTVFKRPQKAWRRNLMGAGVRVGAEWDDFKRALRDDERIDDQSPGA